MKLTYYQSDPPNFGDELNASMWQHLLPQGFLDEDDSELFLGIGSILWDYLPEAPKKIVAGSGFGGYTSAPDVHDGSWSVLWVRGPMTAEKLGLDPELAITDSAVLLRETPLPPPATDVDIAFMPHFQSVDRGAWAEICDLAGVTFLDPRAPVDHLLSQISGARLVITEAMHGAIVSDALRRPWIGVLPFHNLHQAKWQDWAKSLDIKLQSRSLPPSNMREWWTSKTGLLAQGKRSRVVLESGAIHPLNKAIAQRAAAALSSLAEKAEPQMSTDTAIASATDRSMQRLQEFVSGRFPALVAEGV